MLTDQRRTFQRQHGACIGNGAERAVIDPAEAEMYLCTKPRCQRYRVDWAHEQIKKLLDTISFTAGMVKIYKSQLESLIDRDDVTRKTEIKKNSG